MQAMPNLHSLIFSMSWRICKTGGVQNRLRTVSERLKPNKGILYTIYRIFILKTRSQARTKRAGLQMRCCPDEVLGSRRKDERLLETPQVSPAALRRARTTRRSSAEVQMFLVRL